MALRTTLLTLLVAATGPAIAACDHTTKPSSIRNAVTFEFEGTVTESCEYVSLQACTPSTFGSGVAAGTPVTGRLTIDPQAPIFSQIKQEAYASTSYIGAGVELTIGASTVRNNTWADARVEVDAAATFMQWAVMGSGGFHSGQVAGLPIHFFAIGFPIAPSRFPDTSLATDSTLFDQGLRDRPDNATFLVKYIPEPAFRTPGIDVIAIGPALVGHITAIRRATTQLNSLRDRGE